MAEYEIIGQVTHYFGKIGVAVLELYGDLSVGDWIAFAKHGEALFEQEVTSMQIDHQNIEVAGEGDEVALKIDYETKKGVEVYKAY